MHRNSPLELVQAGKGTERVRIGRKANSEGAALQVVPRLRTPAPTACTHNNVPATTVLSAAASHTPAVDAFVHTLLLSVGASRRSELRCGSSKERSVSSFFPNLLHTIPLPDHICGGGSFSTIFSRILVHNSFPAFFDLFFSLLSCDLTQILLHSKRATFFGGKFWRVASPTCLF